MNLLAADPPEPIKFPIDNSGNISNSALGGIPSGNYVEFTTWLLGILLGIAGAIAFILMVIGAINVLTSSGNPDKTKAGSEMITSAAIGLIFIIFSIFLLRFIGVDILGIPGLN